MFSFGSIVSGLGAANSAWSILDKVESCFRKSKVEVTIDGDNTIVIKPVYVRQNDHYYYIDPILDCHDSHQYDLAREALNRELELKQQFVIPFVIKNTGKTPIEDYRFEFSFEGCAYIFELEDECGLKDKGLIQQQGMCVSFESSSRKPIVQNDTRAFSVCLVPNRDATSILIKWKLFAKNYSAEGEVKIYVKPEYHDLAFIHMELRDPGNMPLMEDLPAETKRVYDLARELHSRK